MNFKHTWMAVVAAVGLAACAEATTACGNGETVRINGSSYCVYGANIVIVGGFDCPASMPFRMDFQSATVCGNHGFDNIDVPGDICARAFVPCTEPIQSDAGAPPIFCGGRVCAMANASIRCSSGGTCLLQACEPGFGNCDGQPSNGCETPVGDCGSCACQCGGAETCDGTDNDCDGLIDEQCPDAAGLMDGGLADGATSCLDGGCVADAGNRFECLSGMCSLPGAVATCAIPFLGPCMISECLPGYANCDGIASNGCEVMGACPACARVEPEICDGIDNDCDGVIDNNSAHAGCDLANGGAVCDFGVCRLATCNAGFAQCDGNEANGCETALGTDQNCGACGQTCVVACVTDQGRTFCIDEID